MTEKESEFNERMQAIIVELTDLTNSIIKHESIGGLEVNVNLLNSGGTVSPKIQLRVVQAQRKKELVDLDSYLKELFEKNGRKFEVKEQNNGKKEK